MDSTTPRLTALDTWLRAQFPDSNGGYSLAPASADASFRRYFRITVPGSTYVVMDAPQELEDCRPFVHVAGLMHEAGVNVPRVIAADLDQGFLLLTDLGTRTYLDVLDSSRFDELFRPANDALVKWQRATRAGALPIWDSTRIRSEMNLFIELFLGRHSGAMLDASHLGKLDAVFDAITLDAHGVPGFDPRREGESLESFRARFAVYFDEAGAGVMLLGVFSEFASKDVVALSERKAAFRG